MIKIHKLQKLYDWMTMPKRIFTPFLISQNVAVLSWLVMLVVGVIDIEHMQFGSKVFFFFFFSKIATILVICKHSDSETPS